MSPGFESLGEELLFEGTHSKVRHERFRYPDGSTHEREIVMHPSAVAIVAHDGHEVVLVRQPREAVGEAELLELPAGKLDVAGESELDAAIRELAEEVGIEAASWREMKRFYVTPGWADEEVTVFEATDLSSVPRRPDDEERIEVVHWPLADLDAAIDACRDSKSLIGLLLLRRHLQR